VGGGCPVISPLFSSTPLLLTALRSVFSVCPLCLVFRLPVVRRVLSSSLSLSSSRSVFHPFVGVSPFSSRFSLPSLPGLVLTLPPNQSKSTRSALSAERRSGYRMFNTQHNAQRTKQNRLIQRNTNSPFGTHIAPPFLSLALCCLLTRIDPIPFHPPSSLLAVAATADDISDLHPTCPYAIAFTRVHLRALS
jgi:hypothetical protein